MTDCELLGATSGDDLNQFSERLLAAAAPERLVWFTKATDLRAASTPTKLLVFQPKELQTTGVVRHEILLKDMVNVESGRDWFDWFVRVHVRGGRAIRFNLGGDETATNQVVSYLEQRLTTEEAQRLVGADHFLRYLRDLESIQQLHVRRGNAGLPTTPISRHVVMIGRPGTGKTTAARILAKTYRGLGVLSRGHLVEASRSSLVGGYMGETALKTRAALDEAAGGVLFIDEAYALSPDRPSGEDFGAEAIAELLLAMENNRDDLVVVAAGYPTEMHRFLGSNPGLRSRFADFLNFPDLNDAQLADAVAEFASQESNLLAEGTRGRLIALFAAMTRDDSFGNAREARRVYEAMKRHQARRLRDDPSSKLDLLLPEDIPTDN